MLSGVPAGCIAPRPRALYDELNPATDGTLHIDAEFLVTIARR